MQDNFETEKNIKSSSTNFKKFVSFRFVSVLVGLLFLDQLSKLIFANRDFFLGGMHLHLVKNYGLAFSLNLGQLWNLILVVVGFGVFVFYYRKNDLAFVFIIAGALSNFIDRLYFGYVRDFVDVGLGFTFNLADVLVVLGLVLILLTSQTKSEN